jgi:hypothetical protein
MGTIMALLETAYLPPISWFSAAKRHGGIVLEANETYQKNSYRNRARIATASGELILSVPLVSGKHNQTAIKDVKISDAAPWQRQHWRTLQAAYGKSAFWLHYADALAPHFERPYVFLWDWNLDLIQTLLRAVRSPLEVTFTTGFEHLMGQEGDYRGIMSPKTPDTTLLPYPQVFADKQAFIRDCSIVDLLCCMGPSASQYLR